VVEIVKSYDLTAEELKTLTRILQQAIERNTPAGQVREIIAREVPKARELTKFIKDGWNLPYFLALIASILMWLYPISPSPDAPKKERTIVDELKKLNPQKPTKKQEGKIGANKPCICGSGKKWKKCCGSKQKLQTRSQETNKKPR